jgi:peptidoglycan hydrolase CwlO-like protein
MNKKNGLSIMGYGIVFVIILGVVMIISAPMFLNSNTKSQKDSDSMQDNSEKEYSSQENNFDDLRMMLEQLTSRVDNLEQVANSRNNNNNNNSNVSNKYVCTIEGTLNENGDVVPIDSNDTRSGKIVFVCEYRR